MAVADTGDWAAVVETGRTAVPGIVGSAGTADTGGVAGFVDLVRIVELVDDNAEAAVDTADTVAATEWQPSLTANTEILAFATGRILGPYLRS